MTSNDEDLHIKVARVEQRVEELERRGMEQSADIKSIVLMCNDIKITLARNNTCSAPNSCLSLGETVKRMEARLDKAEAEVETLNESKKNLWAGYKAILWVGSIVITLAGGIYWLWEHVSWKKGP